MFLSLLFLLSALSFPLSIEGIVRHLKNASIRDRLTGLYSRNYFFFFEEWLPPGGEAG